MTGDSRDPEIKIENPGDSFLTKPWVVTLLASFCCFLWGSATAMIKIGYRAFQIPAGEPASQLLFAGVRFVIAGILTVVAGSIIQRKALIPKPESWKNIFALSFFQTMCQYTFFYIGIANTTGVNGSIINGSKVFFSLLVATLIFRQEQLTKQKVLGCILGFAGVIMVTVSGGEVSGEVSLLGEGLVLLASISNAFSATLIRKFSQQENPVIMSGYQFFVGGVALWIVALAMGGELHPKGIEAYLVMGYLCMVSAVAYTIWGQLLKRNPVSKVTIFGFTQPIIGVLLSMLILHEHSEGSLPVTVIAVALVSTGILIVNKAKKE